MSVKQTQSRNPSKIIPERIREAREASGQTAEEFADNIGVTRQAVGQYEIGQSSPSAEVMGRIIAETGQPPAFFTTERRRNSSLFRRPFWRSLKRMERHHRLRVKRRLEWAYDIVQYIEQYIDLPNVDLPEVRFDWQAPEIETFEQIEIVAETLRQHWGMGLGPVSGFENLLESNGFVLIREPVNCDDMDAVSRWQGGRPYILFSEDVESAPRCLFNIAHELGHVLLHSDLEVDADNLNKVEKQANRFAGAFLLPRASFANEVIGSSLKHFEYLKERWGVSIAAMIYRAKDLEIITKNQYVYLVKQMNNKKIRLHEPLDDYFPAPQPSVLIESLKMLIDHNVQSKSDIEDALGINADDIELLCGAEKGFLNNKVVSLNLHPKHMN